MKKIDVISTRLVFDTRCVMMIVRPNFFSENVNSEIYGGIFMEFVEQLEDI